MDIYGIITDRIIAELEKGVVPWQKLWTGCKDGAISYTTGKPYSLLNQFLLSRPGEYLTFKQCQECGGKIKKGEKSHIIVFWKPLPITEKDKDGKDIKKTIPYLRYYNVFHIDQCEGIKPKHEIELQDFVPDEKAERIAAEYVNMSGIKLENNKQDRAYYAPALDKVSMPLKKQFIETPEYYGTLFHELAHSTGHSSRLNRLNKTAAFGNEEYSKEELVAEISSAALLNTCKLETPKTFKNNAAYIQSWLRALKDDKRMIVSAAGQAEKAVKFILTGELPQREG